MESPSPQVKCPSPCCPVTWSRSVPMVMRGRCGMKMREEAAGLRSTPLCTGHSPDRIRNSEDLPHLVTSCIDNRYLV